MFDFGRANKEQIEAITHTEGPLLMIAGPGTGKTFTLVKRVAYLIEEKSIKPDEIMISTFTEKAAKELITRISGELSAHSVSVNLKEMYIGTFHSICLRILKDNLEQTSIKKNYRTLDTFEQQYLVYQNIADFQKIDGFTQVVSTKNKWEQAKEICTIVNYLTEELIDSSTLQADKERHISVTGNILETYNKILNKNNCIDFSAIQSEAYRLLQENKCILEELQKRIQYLMIDEYQDTNYIQEQLAFLIAGEKQNICVVGDDDQGLYRFRGATIRNILEFPHKFESGKCKTITLKTNYRSSNDIVDFYNSYMDDTKPFGFEWGNYRYQKNLKAFNNSVISSPAVIKITAGKNGDWKKENLEFIKQLIQSGKVTDLNQIAFLFNSVKTQEVTELEAYFEQNGIHVYSPRSNMFFERREVKQLLGCLIRCFPFYSNELMSGTLKYINDKLAEYYIQCVKSTEEITADTALGKFLKNFRITSKTNFAYTEIIYRFFEFEPFKSILDTDMKAGVIALRPARNLATLTNLIGRFEYLNQLEALNPANVKFCTSSLFNTYFNFLKKGEVKEYEDEMEYAPSGCVSFLTIHQAKGMEFPIVIVGSLDGRPSRPRKSRFEDIENAHFKRSQFEPSEYVGYFDHWRKYYTAFSRAQDLLVLTADTANKQPNMYFDELFNGLPDWRSGIFKIDEFEFSAVKPVDIKQGFSFTSHVALYEQCPLQYKFFKELGFSPVRSTATIFGSLVHQTIEDVHRAVLRGEEALVTKDNILNWFKANYATLSKSENAYLGKAQLNSAYQQVMRYVNRQMKDWNKIKEAEVDISLIRDDYILEGTIDLIRGENGTVDIVDFKSEKKPDLTKDKKRIERYRRQMQVYSYLTEQKTGVAVNQLHLYYTGEENASPYLTFDNSKAAVNQTIAEFDTVVQKILMRNYTAALECDACENCDFKFYCNARKPKCPICGATLVERTNRTTGQKFMGCPNYYMHKKR